MCWEVWPELVLTKCVPKTIYTMVNRMLVLKASIIRKIRYKQFEVIIEEVRLW